MIIAKLFETDDGRQILVRKNSDEKGNPAVFVEMETSVGLGAVCARFADTKSGWEARDSSFDGIDRDAALRLAKPLIDIADNLEGN